MAQTPDVSEAMERARRAQDERINIIKRLAEARQSVEDIREEMKQKISEAETEDVKAYDAAIKAGWSEAELKKIGFNEPEKRRRTKRRSSSRSRPKNNDRQSPPEAANGEPTQPSAASAPGHL